MTDEGRDRTKNPGHYCAHGVLNSREAECSECTPSDRSYWVRKCNQAEYRAGEEMMRADRAERLAIDARTALSHALDYFSVTAKNSPPGSDWRMRLWEICGKAYKPLLELRPCSYPVDDDKAKPE